MRSSALIMMLRPQSCASLNSPSSTHAYATSFHVRGELACKGARAGVRGRKPNRVEPRRASCQQQRAFRSRPAGGWLDWQHNAPRACATHLARSVHRCLELVQAHERGGQAAVVGDARVDDARCIVQALLEAPAAQGRGRQERLRGPGRAHARRGRVRCAKAGLKAPMQAALASHRPPACPAQLRRGPPRVCARAAHLSPTACRFARWLPVMNSSSGPRSLFLA